MKRIVALTLAAAALAVPATQANAGQSATPTLAQFKTLQKQMKTLQAQVKALQKFVPTSCTTTSCVTLKQATNLLDVTFGLFICHDAVIADEFQATWNVIDQVAATTTTPKVYFGAQTSIADKGACAAFQITRPSIVPPNTAIFSSLVTLLSS
jgi:hypothetical protein